MRTVLRVIPDLLKVLKELLKWLPLLKDLLEELRKYRWRHTGDAPANSGRTVIVKPDAEGDNRTLPIRRLVCMDLRKWIEAAQEVGDDELEHVMDDALGRLTPPPPKRPSPSSAGSTKPTRG